MLNMTKKQELKTMEIKQRKEMKREEKQEMKVIFKMLTHKK